MTGTDRTVEELREMVEGTATDVRMLLFMRAVVRESTRLADTMGIDRPSQAFALAAAACVIADEAGDRNAVLEAMHRAWPEMFAEVTPEEFARMQALGRRGGQ